MTKCIGNFTQRPIVAQQVLVEWHDAKNIYFVIKNGGNF